MQGDNATDLTEYAEAYDASHGKAHTDASAGNTKDEGQVMNSAVVTRDIMQIAEALGDEDMSYFGTAVRFCGIYK